MFSGIVKITELDDYITPSQNCIKPLLDSDKPQSDKENNNFSIDNKFKSKDSIPLQSDLIKAKENNSAKVNLYDCLACSGCVTTAETILIEQQSVDQFIKNSLLINKLSVVTISPQSIYSLANNYMLDIDVCLNRLMKALSLVGVRYVCSYLTGVELVLNKSYDEFLNKSKKFILSSECPGWICYAEKKGGEWIQDYLSKVKSPQQVIGNILKRSFNKLGKDVYHTVIMPCFDKKLESSREENSINEQKEVDTVISTLELEELFKKININFSGEIIADKPIDYISIEAVLEAVINNKEIEYTINISNSCNFLTKINLSSNGYSEYILQRIIYDNKLTDYEIKRNTLKNSDFKEITLLINGTEKYKFALVYGFRNIQNLLRKKDNIKYDYIEIMACPGGCLNGGAQYKSKDQFESSRDILKNIESKISLEAEPDHKDINKINLNLSNLTLSNTESVFKANFRVIKENILTSLKW